MYGEFSGASSLKCLEMVAYHTIHWSCDSVIIVPCMHVITNCVTCLSIYVVYGLRVWNKDLLLLFMIVTHLLGFAPSDLRMVFPDRHIFDFDKINMLEYALWEGGGGHSKAYAVYTFINVDNCERPPTDLGK